MADASSDTLTGTQCRMARAALNLSIDRTAADAGISRASIIRFESGSELTVRLLAILRGFFERSGLSFTPNGVELDPSPKQPDLAA